MKKGLQLFFGKYLFRQLLRTGYFAVFFAMMFSLPVYAYIDPASTAIVTQIVAGVFISLGVAFGIFRRKIAIFFKNLQVKATQRKIEKQIQKENKKDG
jgi:hypothetical protein